MNREMLYDLLNVKKMVVLISKRSILSSPGLDGITFPFLKLEKEFAAEKIKEMIKYMIHKKRIPQIWKTSKTILIYKGGDESKPENYRPITLTKNSFDLFIKSNTNFNRRFFWKMVGISFVQKRNSLKYFLE
jgi:hypothetical protein